MTDIAQDRIVETIAELIRYRLIRGQATSIDGIGRFDLEHVPTQLIDAEDSTVMTPPRDQIVFVSFSDEEKE